MFYIVYWIFGRTSAAKGAEWPGKGREYIGVTTKSADDRVIEHACSLPSGATWLKIVPERACGEATLLVIIAKVELRF